MVANILSVPPPTKERGQRSLSVEDAYFARFIPSWTFPSGLTPAQWRMWVRIQPVAVDFRDTLIASIQSLDWKITPRDSDLRDELKNSTRYHTRLLERGGNWLDLDWTGMLEWILSDLMDLPFGAAVEVGRRGDSPGGRVEWFKPLDGGTLFPTLNKYQPVVQFYNNVEVVRFPKHAVNRMYLSPRPELEREGWGMAPPEKVYLAMEMLSRGDKYYANLLLDVPPAGILDLGDMEKDSALEWVNSFRAFVTGGGVDGFKIPVLYEHTTKPEFIPFGQVPNDIMYDRITLKYAALVGAAYGMSLNDIGLQGTSGSGETLAGSIRSERRTRKTGLAKLKKKLKFFFENMLPDNLQFDWIDLDDELATAKGRARLANATAFGQWIEKGVFDRKEARLQAIQDGLIDVSLPEDPPAKPDPAWVNGGKPQERPGMLGSPQAPSQGGDGEVKLSAVEFKSQTSTLEKAVESVVEIFSPTIQDFIGDDGDLTSLVLESVFSEEDQVGFGEALRGLMSKVRFGEFRFDGLEKELITILDAEGLYATNIEDHVSVLKSRIQNDFPEFIGRAIVYTMVESQFPEVSDMQERIAKSLGDYAQAFVGIEIQRTLDEIRNGYLEIPETLRVRSVQGKPTVANVTVNPNISLPPVSLTLPQLGLHQPDIKISVPEQKSEVVVNVPETVVNIDNKQEPPVVHLSVPEQPPPVVNVKSSDVNVSVQPTPVEITSPVTVNVPKPVKEHQVVHRDFNGNISTTDKDIIYEE